MFPIEAIKQSRNYTLFADDFITHLDFLLMDTGYKRLRDKIALELLYHYLYQNSHVLELRILYTDMCEKLGNMINDYCQSLIIMDSEDLHPLVTPALAELDLIFGLVEINRWGVYIAEVMFNRFEIGYVGDYRILKWSQTDDAKRFHKGTAKQFVYQETAHSFRLG